MPIANVDLTNSLEYFRMITNQCIVAWNGMTNDNTTFSKIVIDTPTPVVGLVALNVANGLLSGNGSGIFSYPNTGIVGVFTNSQLQNSNISFSSGVGVSVGTNTAGLNTGTITITSSVVDSLSNTGRFVPAAANAIPRLLSAIGTYTKTLGRFGVNVGGTGRVGTSYVNGQILLTNSAGALEPNSIPNRTGMILSGSAGLIRFDANITGINATISWTDTSGITITQNTYPNASPTVPGVMRVTDDTANQSTITAASANSLNSVAKIVAGATSQGVINAHGRLVLSNVYSPTSGVGNTIWKSGNVAQVAFIVVTMVNYGGRGGGANNGNSTSSYALGGAGGASATIKGIITGEQLLAFNDESGTGNLTIRYKDRPDGAAYTEVPGGESRRSGNLQIGANGTGYIFLVEPGTVSPTIRLLTNVGLSANAIISAPARAFVNTLAGTLIQFSSGRPGLPGMVTQRGSSGGGAGPSHVSFIGGKGYSPQWERTGWPGDASFDLDPVFWSSNNVSEGGTGGTPKYQGGLLLFGEAGAYGAGGSGAVSANIFTDGSGTYAQGSESGSPFVLIELYKNA
jgi:hypothetical protein